MKVLVKNNDGESSIINIAKYFELNDGKYILYTLNEPDGEEYIKIYASKILINNFGDYEGIIPNELESSQIVGFIKNYVSAKTQNTELPSNTLDDSQLISIKLISKKPFNLNKEMAKLLMESNELKTLNDKTDDIEQSLPSEVTNNNVEEFIADEDYKAKYEKQLEINNQMQNENNNLKQMITQISEIIKHQ